MKLKPEALRRYVIDKFSAADPDVVMQAGVGVDAAAVKACGETLIAVHPDPISGAVRHLGTLSIVIPANDVAMVGAYPRFFTSVLLLPEGSGEDLVDEITSSMVRALSRYGASMVGGHTEFTDSVTRPVVVTTAFGILKAGSLVRIDGVREGDVIVMSKYAGIEGTAVLASDFRQVLKHRGVGEEVLVKGEEMINDVSVVEEANLLSTEALVNAMHDPTEGGILGGLAEMAYASGKLIRAYADRIPVSPVTVRVAEALGIDPLRMLSSGALLASIPRERAEDAVDLLEGIGVKASVIGEVLPGGRGAPLLELVRGSSREFIYDPYIEDEVMKLWTLMRG
ncbi:MAG: AIR synthase family protein [Zestosphaera sp.]